MVVTDGGPGSTSPRATEVSDPRVRHDLCPQHHETGATVETERPADGVCVFAPSVFVTVTAERGHDQDEIHFHAGGQGFWIARLLGRLGVPTTMITAMGGEPGQVARALVESEPVELRAIRSADPSGAWIHDRRSGERVPVAESAGPRLDRHAVDELYGATLASSMDLGVCVLAGPQRAGTVRAHTYERLARDLRRNGVTVIADLSGDHLEGALAGHIDFCKVSDEDLARHTGEPGADSLAATRELVAAGAGHAAITRAGAPLLAIVDGAAVEVSTPTFDEVDHRGAGDAFTALVAATRYWGLPWIEAVRWGAAAGALTVTRRGLATPDRREIHQLLGSVEVRQLDGARRRGRDPVPNPVAVSPPRREPGPGGR